MAIYYTGDKHGEHDIMDLSSGNFPEGKELTKKDYVIVLGDFGLIWKAQSNPTEKYYLDWLDEKPFTTLFLKGNHEQHVRLNSKEFSKVRKFGSAVKQISKSVFMLETGHVYGIEGKKFFVFGGAESIDKARRIEGISWWKEEMPTKREEDLGLKNLLKHGNKVDYILSHTCSEQTFDKMAKIIDLQHKEGFEQSLRKYFNHLEETVEYKYWLFGHFHIDHVVDTKHVCLYHKILRIE